MKTKIHAFIILLALPFSSLAAQFQFCVINQVPIASASINAGIYSVPYYDSQPSYVIKLGELDYINNFSFSNKVCYTMSPGAVKATDANSAIRFVITGTPGSPVASFKQIDCEAIYPSNIGYPNTAQAIITSSDNKNFNCTASSSY